MKPCKLSQDKNGLKKKLSYEYFDKFDSNNDNLMSFKDVEAMLNNIYVKRGYK